MLKPGSRIWDNGSRFFPLPDPGAKKGLDPGSRIRNPTIIWYGNEQGIKIKNEIFFPTRVLTGTGLRILKLMEV
jgi:hypothetical protein